MHESAQYLISQLSAQQQADPRKYLCNLVLKANQVGPLRAASAKDAGGHFYNGGISLIEALGGIQKGAYAWATIKLYYATFFFTWAILKLRGYIIFFVNGKHFLVKVAPGSSPEFTPDKSSHELVFNRFRKLHLYPSILDILLEGGDPFTWMEKLRIDVNYRGVVFYDPISPPHFEEAEKNGLRQLCEVYLLEKSDTYVSGIEHAAIAIPLRLMQYTATEAQEYASGFKLPDTLVRHFGSLCRAGKDPIPSLKVLFESSLKGAS